MTSSNGNIFRVTGTWWRHQMEQFSTLLAICAGNSPVTDEFPTQRPVKRSFGVFFDLRLKERLGKQSWGWWFETISCPLWRRCNDLMWVWYEFTWRKFNLIVPCLFVQKIPLGLIHNDHTDLVFALYHWPSNHHSLKKTWYVTKNNQKPRVYWMLIVFFRALFYTAYSKHSWCGTLCAMNRFPSLF